MKCYYNYCIYQKDNNCTLDDIEINDLGMCEHCEVVTIDEETLNKLKKKRLDKIAEIWGDSE